MKKKSSRDEVYPVSEAFNAETGDMKRKFPAQSLYTDIAHVVEAVQTLVGEYEHQGGDLPGNISVEQYAAVMGDFLLNLRIDVEDGHASVLRASGDMSNGT